jgi:Uma2 family endonuclease
MDNLMLLSETVESQDISSYNHSTIQANLAFLLKQTRQYSVSIALSLDVSSLDPNRFNVKDEIKPDVCIYPKRGLVRPYDMLKMTEMPLLAIEILSPRQAAYEILPKFEIYFALGVKSCWLVDPMTAVISVYAAIDQNQTFSAGEVVDSTLNPRLSLAEIFE